MRQHIRLYILIVVRILLATILLRLIDILLGNMERPFAIIRHTLQQSEHSSRLDSSCDIIVFMTLLSQSKAIKTL